MYNIIKAQMYQIFRENATYYTFIGGIGFTLLGIIFGVSEETIDLSKMTGSEYLSMGSVGMPLLVVILVFTVRICGGDMTDKTINYEMLTGTHRSKVYGGRAVVSLIFMLVCTFLLTLLPVIVFTALNGWGYTMPMKEGITRLALIFIPLIRLTSVFISLTFVTMNTGAVVAIGFIIIFAEGMADLLVEQFIDSASKYLLPFFSLSQIEKIDYYNLTFGYVDGKDVQVLQDGISAGTSAVIVLSGVIVTAAAILIGYSVFRKKDMN